MKYKIFAFEFDESQKVFCSQDFDRKEVLSKYQAIWNSVFSVLLLSSLEDVYFNVVVNFVPNKVLTIRLCDAVAKAKMSYADIEVALLAAKKNPNGNSKFLIYASLHKNGSMFNIRKVSSFISVALSFFSAYFYTNSNMVNFTGMESERERKMPLDWFAWSHWTILFCVFLLSSGLCVLSTGNTKCYQIKTTAGITLFVVRFYEYSVEPMKTYSMHMLMLVLFVVVLCIYTYMTFELRKQTKFNPDLISMWFSFALTSTRALFPSLIFVQRNSAMKNLSTQNVCLPSRNQCAGNSIQFMDFVTLLLHDTYSISQITFVFMPICANSPRLVINAKG